MKTAIMGRLIRLQHDRRVWLAMICVIALIADDGCDCEPHYGPDRGRF